MEELYGLLQKIRERPELYFGKKYPELEHLRSFIYGYMSCLRLYAPSYETCHGFFPGFQEYVQKRYNIASSHSWNRIIDFYSGSEEQSLNTFFDLLDEFLKASDESCCSK